jgi:hypothetical protein
MEDKYEKSLKLLADYISETPKEEITELIKKYSGKCLNSPTFEEYLFKFPNQFKLK